MASTYARIINPFPEPTRRRDWPEPPARGADPGPGYVVDFEGDDWSWSRLGSAGHGWLRFARDEERRSREVPYSIDGTDLLLLVPLGDAGSYADRAVLFEASGEGPESDSRCVVRVIGVTRRDGPAGTRTRPGRPRAQDHARLPAVRLRLTPQRIRVFGRLGCPTPAIEPSLDLLSVPRS